MGQSISSVAVWWISDPPSDPLSRSHLWNVDPVSLVLAVRLTKITCQGLLPWRAGSSFGIGARWLQRWLRDSESTFHTSGLTCCASSANGWWPFPHSTLPPTPRTVGYPIETMECIQMVDPGQACDLWGLQGGQWTEEFQPLWQGFRT